MVSSPWTNRHVRKLSEVAGADCAADSQTEAALWVLDVVNSLTFAADCDKECFSSSFLCCCCLFGLRLEKKQKYKSIILTAMSSSGAQ